VPGETSSQRRSGRPRVGLVGAARDCEWLAGAGLDVLVLDPEVKTRSDEPGAEGRLSGVGSLVVCARVLRTLAGGADLRALDAAARAVAAHACRGRLVLLAAAVPPGTTREVLLAHLVAAGRTPGRDFLLACSPPAAVGLPRAVGGLDGAGTEAALALLGRAGVPAVRVSSLEAAELCGGVSPTLAAIRAAAVNEVRVACDRMGIDPWEVLAVGGESSPTPNRGLGGPEASFLPWGARRWGAVFRLAEAAAQVNAAMPTYVINKVADALNDAGKAVRGSKVAILGMAYKKDVDDPRESPSFELMDLLLKKGAKVSYSDPHIPSLPRMRHWPHLEPMEGNPLTPEYLAEQDCVLIATDHTAFDYAFIVKHGKLVIDACGATRDVAGGTAGIVRA
jgi:UDP-N-acetyl-D-glucosamine dehydrogenase